MTKDEPPMGGSLYPFPPLLTGYDLRLKKWGKHDFVPCFDGLYPDFSIAVGQDVDRIADIEWNKQNFGSLVVNTKTKELVKALVANRLTAEKSTDLIQGRGNGLTILLDGGLALARHSQPRE
jgi:hypothetical protein